MVISVHLVNLVHWRWTSSVGLVLAACLPVGAATLLIPSDFDPPWGSRANAMLPRAATERTTDSAERDARFEAEATPVAVTAANEPLRHRSTKTPLVTREMSQPPSRLRTRARGHFVPAGETDDARALELRGGVRR